MKDALSVLLVLAVSGVVLANANTTTNPASPTTKPATSTVKPVPTTTANANSSCAQYTDCDSCVQNSKGKCLYCNDAKKCEEVVSKGFFNEGKVCKGGLMAASWITCSVNMMALIIGMGVVGGVLIISLCACICCCCCCKNSAKQKLKWMRQDATTARKTEERKSKYAERRAERQAKNDEIRKKYGLFKGDQGGYQRMDDDA